MDGRRIERSDTGDDGRMFSKSSSVGGTDDAARSTVSTDTDRGHSKKTSPLSPLRGGRRLVGETLGSRQTVDGELDDTSYAASCAGESERVLGSGDASSTRQSRDDGGGERKRTLLGAGDGATVDRGAAPGFFIAERRSDGAGLAEGKALRISWSEGVLGCASAAAAAAAAVRARVCLTGVASVIGARLIGSAGTTNGEAGVSLRAELGGVDVGRALKGDRRPRKSSMSDNSVEGDRARIGGDGDGASDIRSPREASRPASGLAASSSASSESSTSGSGDVTRRTLPARFGVRTTSIASSSPLSSSDTGDRRCLGRYGQTGIGNVPVATLRARVNGRFGSSAVDDAVRS